MRRNVAGAAGIGVLPPRTAETVGSLKNHDARDPCLPEAYCGAKSAEAGADHGDPYVLLWQIPAAVDAVRHIMLLCNFRHARMIEPSGKDHAGGRWAVQPGCAAAWAYRCPARFAASTTVTRRLPASS